MRAKRIVALALTGCLLFGQTTWAADVVSGESMTEEMEKQQEQSAEKEDGQNSNAASLNEKTQDSESGNNGVEATKEIAYTERNAYVGHSFDIWDYRSEDKRTWNVETDDQNICNGQILESDGWNTHIIINALQEGDTTVRVKCGDELIYAYHITVKNVPENYVCINDVKLIEILKTDGIDISDDGLVTKQNMEKIERVDVSNSRVEDLTGLEYAVNMTTFSAYSNSDLKSIKPLLQLEKLQDIELGHTNISPDERWQIARVKDELSVAKGGRVEVYDESVFTYGDEPNVVIEKGADNVTHYEGSGHIYGKKEGEVTLQISYYNYVKDVTVTVEGIPADQKVGEKSDIKVLSGSKGKLLDSNGKLWKLYPRPEVEKENVKNYIGGWVYADKNEISRYGYVWDTEDKVWEDGKLLAENVKECSGYYVLDKKGIMKNIYNTEADSVENVKKYIEYQNNYSKETYTYVLKNDGTLWERKEVKKSEKVNSFEMVNTEVTDIDENGRYVRQNGEVLSIYDSNDEPELTDAKSVLKSSLGGSGGEYYINKDGNTCLNVMVRDENGYYNGEYINLGKTNIIRTIGYADWTEESELIYFTYYLTDEGNLYKIEGKSKKELIATDVEELAVFSKYIYKTKSGEWKTLDGEPGTVETPLEVDSYRDYSLMDYGAVEDYNLNKNEALILTHVTQIWEDEYDGKSYEFARRTDGTVWDVTNVPKDIANLASDKLVSGDVNADGEVDIQDLRSILRYICEKEEFNEDQKSAADVDANGEVDIKDLRKVIRYVCGKESVL